MNIIEKALFTTQSLKIAGADRPFWYTSGTIGPYFINTHFLYGGENEANALLDFIDKNKGNVDFFLQKITQKVISFYHSNKIFGEVIDEFMGQLKLIPEFRECEYISGGERRDWFFSPIIASLAGKKNLFIYKDLTVYSNGRKVDDLAGARVCHICDLITLASSYQRAWIPAIKAVKGNFIFTAGIVNRDEGGIEFLNRAGIKTHSAANINREFLTKLKTNFLISEDQFNCILDFKKDPVLYGKKFLESNPEFLAESLNDNSAKSKAARCINENPYGIDFSALFGDRIKQYL